MTAKKHVIIDKSELVLMYLDGNTYQSANLSSSRIIRIQFGKCYTRKLLWRIQDEKIEIVAGNRTITYIKSREARYFNDYKAELEIFAKDNRITFINNISG